MAVPYQSQRQMVTHCVCSPRCPLWTWPTPPFTSNAAEHHGGVLRRIGGRPPRQRGGWDCPPSPAHHAGLPLSFFTGSGFDPGLLSDLPLKSAGSVWAHRRLGDVVNTLSKPTLIETLAEPPSSKVHGMGHVGAKDGEGGACRAVLCWLVMAMRVVHEGDIVIYHVWYIMYHVCIMHYQSRSRDCPTRLGCKGFWHQAAPCFPSAQVSPLSRILTSAPVPERSAEARVGRERICRMRRTHRDLPPCSRCFRSRGATSRSSQQLATMSSIRSYEWYAMTVAWCYVPCRDC